MRGCTQGQPHGACVRPIHSCIGTALAATRLLTPGKGWPVRSW